MLKKTLIAIILAGAAFAQDQKPADISQVKASEVDLERIKRTEAEIGLAQSSIELEQTKIDAAKANIERIKQQAADPVRLHAKLVEKYCGFAGVPKDKMDTECMIDRNEGLFTWKKPSALPATSQ